MPTKFGLPFEVVKFIEFGKEHYALPTASREPEHHLGQGGEPVLTLVLVKPVVADQCARCHFAEHFHGKPFSPSAEHRPCDSFVAPPAKAVVDPNQLVQIVGDVPHESHQFTEESLAALERQGHSIGISFPGNRIPGGRWRELNRDEAEEFLDRAAEIKLAEVERAKKLDAAKSAKDAPTAKTSQNPPSGSVN